MNKEKRSQTLNLLGLQQCMAIRYALIKFGGGVVGMSGSIAGTTFARNRYGSYARARVVPVNPRTARQVAVRSAMAFLTAHWSDTLTAGQRTAWNLYGSNVAMKNRLGENVFLTGFNHFIRSNAWLARIGDPPIAPGPVVFELPAADPTLGVTASEATQQISVTYDDGMPWADENGARLLIYMGSPQNPQRNFFDGPWRYASSVAGVNGAPPAPPKLIAVPFPVAELQHLWIYARIMRADGRLSEPFRDDSFVGA